MRESYKMRKGLFPVIVFIALGCAPTKVPRPIDRYALVSRHNITLTAPDTLGALTVGNGEFAFTVDASGLQTFPDEYEHGLSLGTMAQWAWHKTEPDEPVALSDVLTDYETCSTTPVPYAIQHGKGTKGTATNWLRSNPHRLHLGLVGLLLTKKDGSPVQLAHLNNLSQTLNLYTGILTTQYSIDGEIVTIQLVADPDHDRISAKIESALIRSGHLQILFQFPYGKECHTCPGYDFNSPDDHSTQIIRHEPTRATLERRIDSTRYWVDIGWSQGAFIDTRKHRFTLRGSLDSLEFNVLFSEDQVLTEPPPHTDTELRCVESWKHFWEHGGAIDFSACTDLRAHELERRVILSQYLTRIQCAGSLPPQETGLTFNSWFGKFHLEMHWWHATHFALWSRPELLGRSMPYYASITGKARTTAQTQGYDGVRWPKMTDPYGNESPSSVGAFLIWQQPHPIYFSELMFRQDAKKALDNYSDLVFQTAGFMASFAKKGDDGYYHLCHPLIPAQEIFKPETTNDPIFELAYWKYALTVAQEWRRRKGMSPHPEWQQVIDNLTPYPLAEEKYLPEAGSKDAYRDDWYRRDHPIVTGIFGMLPHTAGLDQSIMSNTLDEVMKRWDWSSTWGWDYPMLAMCAARLGKPELAVDALLMDVPKNTYLANGHNYQDERLRIYLPGNGGLLAAVAMMAGGWDGSDGDSPGFPKDGKWNIRCEGFVKMP